jgi:F0F1-type ATP synthase, alpha subunit
MGTSMLFQSIASRNTNLSFRIGCKRGKQALLGAIREKKELDKDLESQLKAALDEFKTTWR